MASYGLRDIYLMGRGGPSNDINGGGFTNYLPRQRGGGGMGVPVGGGSGRTVRGGVSMSPYGGEGVSGGSSGVIPNPRGGYAREPGGGGFTNYLPRVNDPRLARPYGIGGGTRPPMQRRPPSNIGW